MGIRNIIICFLCTVVGIGLLIGASTRLDPINSARKEMALISNEPLENAPPSLAFATVAMGAFRGLVVDVLWMRAEKLKEEGQFFDAKQLAEWITILQPRFAGVWDFQAWNMAYNISVVMPASQWQERWRWVRNGYELLRDKGIEKNPHSILLYRSLAWIFQHKMGGVTDDCHKHYKRELALGIRPLLGDQSREFFEALSNAPENFSDILSDPDVEEFVEVLKSSEEAFGDEKKFAKNYITLRRFPDRFEPLAHLVINRFRDTETLRKFDVFARAYELRKTWKLDPGFMQKMNNLYGPYENDPNDRGPLNWEHTETHAIYWAQLGLEVAGKPEEYSFNEKNTDRIVFHSLQNLYRRGQIIIYPVPEREPSVFLRPDLRMFDSCDSAWTERIDKYESFEGGNPKGIYNGYRNMLINAVGMFYQGGHIKKAGEIYLKLRKRFPRKEFNVPLKTFVRKRVAEEIKDITINDATELILMSLREAYFRYAVHADDEAYGRESWAKEVYDIYKKEYSEELVLRVDLPSFEMMRYLSFMGFMNDNYYPHNLRRSLLSRIEVERPGLVEKLKNQEAVFNEKVQEASEGP